MDKKLQQCWTALNQSWNEMMALTEDLSAEQFFWSPADGAWSIDQVFHHLFNAEQLSLNYVKKKTSGTNKIPQTGVVHELKWKALKTALTAKKKWKAPPMVSNIPPVEDHDALIKDWMALRIELREFVEELPIERRTAEVYRHPIAGRMNVYHMLDFFIYHARHHQYQIQRILKAMKENV